MATKAQKVRLALFFIISGSVLSLFLIVVAGSHLLKKRDHYFIEFANTSVHGLTPGAQVKYQGIAVGQVEEMFISPRNVNTVVVSISLDPKKINNAIRTDTRASMFYMGITGLKYVELVAGSQEAELLPPGSQIPTAEGFLGNIEARAEVLTGKVEAVLDNITSLTSRENTIQFNRVLTATGSLMETTSYLVEENRVPIRQTFENLALMTHSLARTSSTLQATMDSLHQILTGQEMRHTVANLEVITHQVRQQMEKPLPDLIARIDKMTANIDRTFTHIDLTVVQSRKNILDALQELEETLQNVREATALVREDPSVLIRGRSGEP